MVNSGRRRIRHNTAYNVLGAAIPMGATLFTLPRYLLAIGDARYGVLAILWTLLGYFGLFDLGLGRATTNQIAALGDASRVEREQIFWTALLLNLSLGLAGALVLWGAGAFMFSRFVAVPHGLAREVSTALPWMALAFPLLLTSSVLSGALMGREDFLHTNIVRVVEGVFVQVAPLVVALKVGPELPALVIAVLSVRLITSSVLFLFCARRLPLGRVPRFCSSLIRPLFTYGGWVTVSSIVSPLLSTLDRVLIGAVAGVRAVTYYTVPFSLASRLSILPGSLSNALFPRFSSQPTESDRRVLQARAIRSLTTVVTPPVVVGIMAMAPFLAWWVSPEFSAKAAPVGEVLLLGIWFNCLAFIPYSMLQGGGRPDLVAKAHVLEAVIYVPALWVALKYAGIIGAAAAWSLRVGLDTALLFYLAHIEARLLRWHLVPVTLLIVTAVVVFALAWQTPTRVLLGVVAVTVSLAWSWMEAPQDIRQLITRLRRADGNARVLEERV